MRIFHQPGIQGQLQFKFLVLKSGSSHRESINDQSGDRIFILAKGHQPYHSMTNLKLSRSQSLQHDNF